MVTLVSTQSETLLDAQLAAIRMRIQTAETQFGRRPGSVALLAVSKQQPITRLLAAYTAGQRAFGESYVNEALTKQAVLREQLIDWHFIGRIQTNKTRLIANHFNWVHSVSDFTHAQRLSQQRPPDLPPLHICIQVNISAEETKNGLAPAALADFIKIVRELPRLSIEGLMTLPAQTDDFSIQRRTFADLRTLRDQLAKPELPLTTLSMGTSDDLEAAIAEGATIVRVGTALFGARAGDHF
ncbi:YggS family pyridoxal phosphate-dependent enzyme [Rhodoferax sp. 4810]|uniref:Pyridoxal phosphate homeostasis protein n=1 Tax=Thiospirillum jenense TaxID=1653858 RepID=A0A839HNA7_9GAMM|nr:YggS family pyridoxal phosphate-dependent enzyme [Thiospirillum jenense]MBB1075483.1 YggS family pyridoxal phosphate-dependent enzyme [Rhodoferax jenense]MBB1126862.1 YggS family pyridoxal phosphate-dependent enzyme [Thiospirillum jenense]